ncbi:hypothetical protein ACHAWT_005141 [Skeletonema menzelii]
MSYKHDIRATLFFVYCILLLACTVAYAQECSGAADCTSTDSPLGRARLLGMPQAIDTQNAEFENERFWNDHGSLVQQAWREWEMKHATTLSDFNNDVKERRWMNSSLLDAIDDAFANPSEESEAAVKSLWTNSGGRNQVLPKGVYATQLLSPSGVSYLRKLIDVASLSGIPTRRPNGMNRHGMIVDSNVYGAVPVQPLVETVEEIIDRILRPVGRMLFQDRIGCEDDLDYYAFTISYDGTEMSTMQSKDMDLKEHRDASVVTLNINLNLPEENYEGSEVFFRGYPAADSWSSDVFGTNSKDEDGGGTVTFSPGMAIIHLGAHRHGALPIMFDDSGNNSEGNQTSGKRFNLVVWLFGELGDVRIAPYSNDEQLTAKQRWHGCNQ